MYIPVTNNLDNIELLTKENIYEITSALLKNKEIKISIIAEIANRVVNAEPITWYDLNLINWNWDPECSTIWEMVWVEYWKLKALDIIHEGWYIYIVLENITFWWIHKYSLSKEILIDVINVSIYNKNTLTLNVPITPRIWEFLKKYKSEILNLICI